MPEIVLADLTEKCPKLCVKLLIWNDIILVLKFVILHFQYCLLWTDVYITERCPVPLKHFGRIWTMELTIMSWLFHHCATAASNSQRKLKFIILFMKFLQYFSITQNIEQASNMLTEFKFTEYYTILNRECYN